MQVSAHNVIRFPVAPPAMPPRVERNEPSLETAQVVSFRPVEEDPALVRRSQEHNQLFVAQRIAGRIADQLEQVATL